MLKRHHLAQTQLILESHEGQKGNEGCPNTGQREKNAHGAGKPKTTAHKAGKPTKQTMKTMKATQIHKTKAMKKTAQTMKTLKATKVRQANNNKTHKATVTVANDSLTTVDGQTWLHVNSRNVREVLVLLWHEKGAIRANVYRY